MKEFLVLLLCVSFAFNIYQLSAKPVVKPNPAVEQTVVATVQTASDAGAGEKVIARTTGEFRIYAEDGTFMRPTETEFINATVGEPIFARQWFLEK